MKLICSKCGIVHSARIPDEKVMSISTDLPGQLNVIAYKNGMIHQFLKCQCPRCREWTVTIEDDDPVVYGDTEQTIKKSAQIRLIQNSFFGKVLNHV
jgi:hypothetical protein